MKLLSCKSQPTVLESKSISPSHLYGVTQQTLNKENTSWVFIAGQANPRHLDDILFGIWILLRRGVSKDLIFVFTDHPKSDVVLKELDIDSSIHALDSLEKNFSNLVKSEHVVLSVTGHGSNMGIPIGNTGLISPHKFLEVLRSPRSLKSITLLLCQCYAGVFNYMDVRTEPKICILGATNLHLSLSAQITLTNPIVINEKTVLHSWQANIFMWKFFMWISALVDIDGDGSITMLDGYKFAGSLSNDDMRLIKKIQSQQIDRLKKQISGCNITNDPTGLAKKGLEAALDEVTNYLYLTQEPWILYPDFGRHLILIP